MGTTITKEQNSSAAKAAAENLSARFGDAGVTLRSGRTLCRKEIRLCQNNMLP